MLILFLPEIESWTQQTSLRMRTVWCSGRLPEGKQRPMLQWQAEGQNSWLQIRMLFHIGPWVLSEIDHQNIYSQLFTSTSRHDFRPLASQHCHLKKVAPWNASLDSVDMLDLWTHQWASLDQWAKRRSAGCQKSATKNVAAGKMEGFLLLKIHWRII